eukprot:14821098-Alexandrium_andersonii.AAC.1
MPQDCASSSLPVKLPGTMTPDAEVREAKHGGGVHVRVVKGPSRASPVSPAPECPVGQHAPRQGRRLAMACSRPLAPPRYRRPCLLAAGPVIC